jgi:hypothetical protein
VTNRRRVRGQTEFAAMEAKFLSTVVGASDGRYWGAGFGSFSITFVRDSKYLVCMNSMTFLYDSAVKLTVGTRQALLRSVSMPLSMPVR